MSLLCQIWQVTDSIGHGIPGACWPVLALKNKNDNHNAGVTLNDEFTKMTSWTKSEKDRIKNRLDAVVKDLDSKYC